MKMTDNERELVRRIASDDQAAKQQFLTEYLPVIRKDIHDHSQPEQFPERVEMLMVENVIQEFFAVVKLIGDDIFDYTIEQVLHLLAMQALIESNRTRNRYKAITKIRERSLRAALARSIDAFIPSEAGRLSSPRIKRRRVMDIEHGEGFIIQSNERMTAGFLSAVLVPYVSAISAMQQVCNAVLKRPPREVTIRSISQNSPMDIKLLDAAEAINALKEDIIPWRKEHAQEMAALKELDIAADIKKKEEEALEIRARATKDAAESEKIRAEAAKVREEVEQLRIENEKRSFELKKAKLDLALEIVSKMQPNLPLSERYIHAMQLLPQIDTFTTSPVEPSRLTS
jgi:hypothetical protein